MKYIHRSSVVSVALDDGTPVLNWVQMALSWKEPQTPDNIDGFGPALLSAVAAAVGSLIPDVHRWEVTAAHTAFGQGQLQAQYEMSRHRTEDPEKRLKLADHLKFDMTARWLVILPQLEVFGPPEVSPLTGEVMQP